MKRKISLVLLFMVMLVSFSPSITHASTRMIASDGFVTSHKTGTKTCDVINEDAAKGLYTSSVGSHSSSSGSSSSSSDSSDPGFAVDALNGMINAMITGVISLVQVGCTADQVSGLGLFSQIYIFSEPVNVTNVQTLMDVTGIIQWISLTVMVFGILVYGYEVTVGKAEIDPFKFSFRYLFSMFFVYYAPYVVQDILNLNNEIVDTIGNYGMKMGGITVNVATILPMSFIGFVKSIGDLVDSGQGLKGLATILIMLIVLIMVFIPLLKLVVWWYVRLFKIFLYTALSPLMFASLCIENTAKTGFNFLRNFVQEVFGQLFLVIALFVTGAFIAQLPTLSANSNIGIIGVGIALYAALSFLHEVPALANGLLDGSSISRYGARVSDGVGAIRSSLGRHSSNLVPRNMRAAYQKSSVGRAANFAKDRIGNHQLGSNKKIESVLKSQAKSSKQLRKSFNK